MGNRDTMGKKGFAGAIATAILMRRDLLSGGAPSPTDRGPACCRRLAHEISAPLSWATNLLLLFRNLGSIISSNKSYAFVPGNDMTLPGLLAVMSFSCPGWRGL